MVIIEPIKYRVPIAKPKKGVAGKTGSWRWVKPVVNLNKCTRCFLCEIYCPDNTIIVDPEKGALVDYDYCKGCGVCAQVCPVKAIEMVSEER